MALTLRATKGSRLTHAEVDANWSGLADGSLLNATALAAKTFTTLALSGALTVAGITTSAPILAADGSAAAPAYAFSGATGTGMARSGGNLLFGVAGVQYVQLNGRLDLASTVELSWLDNTIAAATVADLKLVRDAANTLAQRNGANAQAFNIYNTFTDASNYELGQMRWVSNELRIGTGNAGTGSGRAVQMQVAGVPTWKFALSGNFESAVDNVWDFGQSAAGRPRTGYFGTSVSIGAAASAAMLSLSYDSAATNSIRLVDTNAAGNEWLIGPGAGAGSRGDFNIHDVTGAALRFAVAKTTGVAIAYKAFYAGASQAAYVELNGNSTGNNAIIGGVGETNTGLDIYSSGGGPLRFLTNGRNQLQFQVTHTASAVNYLQATGAATGAAPTLSVQGETNVSMLIVSKGTGGIQFQRDSTVLALLDGGTIGDGSTALQIRRNVGGILTLQTVSMGATDSGGAGFKVLRVPN